MPCAFFFFKKNMNFIQFHFFPSWCFLCQESLTSHFSLSKSYFFYKASINSALSLAPCPIISSALRPNELSLTLYPRRKSKLLFINHLPRVLCKINNTMSMLYLGKMKFKKVGDFPEPPCVWRKTNLSPSLSNSSSLGHDMLFSPLTCGLCPITAHIMQAYYIHFWNPCSRKSAVHIICALESVWWMNFEVLLIIQILGIFMALNI